jgi:hypothetical protein
VCHISHRRYRWDDWAWSGRPVDEVDEVDEREVAVSAPASAGPARDPDLRVGQAERDAVVAALARHFADGRLTVEEYEERVEGALAARTGHDLEPLLADLPAEPPVRPARASTYRLQPVRTRPAYPSPRVIAVVAVLLLVFWAGPWALWLLWPALILTRGCGSFSAQRSPAREDYAPRPPAVSQRL